MGEKTFKTMVLNEIDKREWGFAGELAAKVGYKTSSNMNKVLYTEEKEFKDFRSVLKLTEILFPNEQKTMISKYVKALDPTKKSARVALEYLWLEKMEKDFLLLLNLMKNCSDTKSKEWAEVYELDFKSYHGDKSPIDVINELFKKEYKTPEMKVFSKLVAFYCYYDLRQFNLINQMEQVVYSNLDDITDKYIFNSYKARIGLMKTDIYVHKGDLINARKYGMDTLGYCENKAIRSLTCLQIGNSFMFENTGQSYLYLEEALNNASRDSLANEVKRSINFLSSLWNTDRHMVNFESVEVSDLHEQAHYYISINENTKALEILDSMDKNEMTDSNLGFHFYYKGLITNSVDNYYNSIKYFNKCEEKFYKKAPLVRLKSMGERDIVLEALSV